MPSQGPPTSCRLIRSGNILDAAGIYRRASRRRQFKRAVDLLYKIEVRLKSQCDPAVKRFRFYLPSCKVHL